MKELLREGTVVLDASNHRYYMSDGGSIMRRNGESLADAALRTQTMTHRSIRTAASNLITLEDEVQNYYQQVNYQEESDEGYESDEDEGPYWKTALHTSQGNRTYEEEQYEDEDDYGYYVDPTYQSYPAERSSTRIAEACENSSRLPIKPQPKQRFEGVYPPQRKTQIRPGQNLPTKPIITPTPAPTPQPIQPSPLPKPQPASIPPRVQQPIDARKPRNSEDVEMKEPQPTQFKPSNIPRTLPRDPPPHVTFKENPDKALGPLRQSELSSQINTKTVVSENLNTEIPLTLGKLLGASKELSFDLQERLRPRNRPLEVHNVATGTEMGPTKRPGHLLTLQVQHEGVPMTAIIDTGSELNLIRN